MVIWSKLHACLPSLVLMCLFSGLTLMMHGEQCFTSTIDQSFTDINCSDIGTVPNQTVNGQPEAATINGDTGHHGILSFLPGQRLSRCTCPGESHPGPIHSDGTFVGRSAPEIDVFEAQVCGQQAFYSSRCSSYTKYRLRRRLSYPRYPSPHSGQ